MKRTTLIFLFLSLLSTTNQAQVIKIRGLAVIVEYPDKKFDITTEYLDSMLNQKSGFTVYNHAGSLREYFFQQTNSRYDITHQIVRLTMSVNSDYFTGSVSPTGQTWDAGQVFVDSVSTRLQKLYPTGFSNLTLDPRNSNPSLWSYLFITSRGGVAFGISSPKTINNNGSPMLLNHVALAGIGGETATNNSTSTIAHECGHAIFGFPDYYITDTSRPLEISNIGSFCLMGSGGNSYNPQGISGGLRVALGTTAVVDIPDNVAKTYKIKSNDRTTIYRYKNPHNANEYFLIEAFKFGDWYLSPNGDGFVMDQGLAIWHVYQNTNNARGPWLKLVQADGIDKMNLATATHKEARGCDLTDLFGTGTNGVTGTGVKVNAVNGEINPLMRWRDGTISGLYLSNISAPADSMSFTVEHRDYTITSRITGSSNGTMSPMGIISASNGGSKTFAFTPDMGYEVNTVLVDGVSQGSITSYTFNNVTANHTISVSFKSVISVLPDPWIRKEFGGSTTGKSDYLNGTCRIETNGLGISTTDNFHFVYQPLVTDGEIIARVASMNQPDQWTKVGLMMRETLAANSRYMIMMQTSANGPASQYRNTASVVPIKNDKTLATNQWLKLKRSGSCFTAYSSSNGVDWILFDTQTVNMTTGTVYVGLFVTGATSSTKAIATFDNVKLTLEDVNTFFTASADEVLSGSTVTYTDQSTNTPTSWKWTFYGATTITSTAKNPTVNYIVPGVYPVSCVTKNSQGVATLSKTLTVIVTSPGTLISPLTPTAIWKLKSVDSEETVAENGAATNAFDGDPKTYWHTKYQGGAPAYPHEIVINMGKLYDLTGVGYLPRSGGASTNGRFRIFDVYVSINGVTWPSAASYTFRATGTDDAVEKTYGFPSVKAQYLKIIGRSACNNSVFGGAAEIRAYGTLSVTNAVSDITELDVEIYSSHNQLHVNMGDISSAKVYVYSILGQLIQTNNLHNGLNNVSINFSGIHVVKVISNNKTLSKIVFI